MSISIKTYDKTSSLVRYDLDKLRVFIEDDHLQPQFFDVEFLPTYLSYGRHAFNISFKDSEYEFVKNSLVLFEFKDRDGKVIYSKSVGPFIDTKTYETTFNGYGEYGKSGFGFVDIQTNPLESYFEIPDGVASMTLVGELTGVPTEWLGKYNVRLTLPVTIRKDIENTSPLMFSGQPTLDVRLLTDSQKDGARGGALPSLIKTFAHASFDGLTPIGGSIDTIDLDFFSDASGKSSFQLLDRFRIAPVELLTSSHSKIDYLPPAGTSTLSKPGVPIGQFTELNEFQVHPTYDWNTYKGSDRSSTNMIEFAAGSAVTGSSGNHIMSGSARMFYQYAGGIDGGVGKLVRRTIDTETFDLKYNISGSAEISIWYSDDRNHFQVGGSEPMASSIMPCPFISQSLMTLAYSASFRDFNPSGSFLDGVFTPYSGSFMNGDLITSASSDYNDPSGENTQIIKDTFSIPSGSWFAIYVHPVSSSLPTTSRCAYISNVSIKHHPTRGRNIPFFYDRIELSGFAKRNENLKFKSTYYSKDGQNGISILNPSVSYTSSFSPFEYFPEGFAIERGAGAGYSVNNGTSGAPNFGISVGAKFTNVTTGSFNKYNSGWAQGSASIGVWGEAAFGGDVDIGGVHSSTFNSLYPGAYGTGNQPKLYGSTFTRGPAIGGFFVAARHTASNNFTVGLQVGAWESSSAGWMTASNADNLWSARFESGDVFVGDNLIISGNIEANEYIISSSTTYYTQSQYNGNSNFGDGCDDVHSFSGSIIQDCGTGTYFSSSAGSIEISGSFGEAHLHVDGHITASGHISASGVFSQNIHTLTQNNATPSVAAGNLFITNNTSATTITGLTNGVVGQEVTIIVNDTNTDFQDGTNFNLFRSLNWTTATTNDVLRMLCVDGTKWVSTGRLDNS